MTATCSDSLQSQRVMHPFISFETTYLELNDGLAMPLSKVLTHFDLPILQGSPDSINSLPSGKNQISQAGGVIKFTLIGFLMRTSCSMMALETEMTQGETGCAETAMGVDSCPFKGMDLFLVRLQRVTSLCVQVRRTSLSNWSISMTSVFWQGWNLLAYWYIFQVRLYRYCRMRPFEQPQKRVFQKDSTLLRMGVLPFLRPLGQVISVGLGMVMAYYQYIDYIIVELAKKLTMPL